MALPSVGLVHCAAQQAATGSWNPILYMSQGGMCDLGGKQCKVDLVCKPTDLETNRCVDPATYSTERENAILACRAMNYYDRARDETCRSYHPRENTPLRSATFTIEVPFSDSGS